MAGLKDDWLMPQVSEDGRYMLVTTSLVQPGLGGNAPRTRPDLTSPPRIWEIESGKPVPAPAEPMKVRMSATHFHVALGANAAWVAWLERTQPNAVSGFRGDTKGPLEHVVNRWDAASGKVTRTNLTVGTGWGQARLGPDGRTVHWYPVSEQSAAGKGGSNANTPTEYGEYQVWDIEKPAKPRCALRVPVARGPTGTPPTALSPSWRWLATWDSQKITVNDLADGQVRWQVPLPAGYPEKLLPGFSGPQFGFAVSDDGNRVVVHGPDAITVLDNTPAGKPTERRVFYRPAANPNSSRNLARDFHLLPDGDTLVRWEFDAVRVWNLSRDASGLALPNAPGGRQLVTDPDGRSWFVLRSADGRRALKSPAPPLPGAAIKGEPVPAPPTVVLDGDGKELAKLDLGPAGTQLVGGSWAT
ncbi:MAG: hypothetical protein K2V38_01105, partial [Gemmataceae bacterium]|nr:hypothetical protein [Gemmataceae bacterium]